MNGARVRLVAGARTFSISAARRIICGAVQPQRSRRSSVRGKLTATVRGRYVAPSEARVRSVGLTLCSLQLS